MSNEPMDDFVDNNEETNDNVVTVTEYVFSNNVGPNGEQSPAGTALFRMFYQGVYHNQVGVMEALNNETGEQEFILVGVELDEDNKPMCYPIASILTDKEVIKYFSPDGKGGFFDLADPVAVAEAKEGMEALVPHE